MSEIKHFENARPKKNLTACVECGHWQENHTICGKEFFFQFCLFDFLKIPLLFLSGKKKLIIFIKKCFSL